MIVSIQSLLTNLKKLPPQPITFQNSPDLPHRLSALKNIFQEAYNQKKASEKEVDVARKLLSEKEVADALTPEMISFLFTYPRGQNIGIQLNPDTLIPLPDIIIQGFEDTELLYALYTEAYEKNTARILAAIAYVQREVSGQYGRCILEIQTQYEMNTDEILEGLDLTLDQLLMLNGMARKDYFHPGAFLIERLPTEIQLSEYCERERVEPLLFIPNDLLPHLSRNSKIIPMTKECINKFPQITSEWIENLTKEFNLDPRFSFIVLVGGEIQGYLIAGSNLQRAINVKHIETKAPGIGERLMRKLKQTVEVANFYITDGIQYRVVPSPFFSELVTRLTHKVYYHLVWKANRNDENIFAIIKATSFFQAAKQSLPPTTQRVVEEALTETRDRVNSENTDLLRKEADNEEVIVKITNAYSKAFAECLSSRWLTAISPSPAPCQESASPHVSEGFFRPPVTNEEFPRREATLYCGDFC